MFLVWGPSCGYTSLVQTDVARDPSLPQPENISNEKKLKPCSILQESGHSVRITITKYFEWTQRLIIIWSCDCRLRVRWLLLCLGLRFRKMLLVALQYCTRPPPYPSSSVSYHFRCQHRNFMRNPILFKEWLTNKSLNHGRHLLRSLFLLSLK